MPNKYTIVEISASHYMALKEENERVLALTTEPLSVLSRFTSHGTRMTSKVDALAVILEDVGADINIIDAENFFTLLIEKGLIGQLTKSKDG